MMPRFEVLKVTCLRQSFSLRRQLTTAYGSLAFVTIFCVVLCATIAALRAGNAVTSQTEALFSEQLFAGMNEGSTLTVDILTKKFRNLKSASSLLVEIVRDRIVGYPDDGWEDDRHVPFVDRVTRKGAYPLKADLLPRDWQVKSNWNATNLEEHTQERADVFRGLEGILSTESAFFFWQGNCDPNHTLPSQPAYFPVCSDGHNNASMGGLVNPTETLAPLEQKAADIGVFLKAIWESEPSALVVNVYYFNSGAGASSSFPSYRLNSSAHYVSTGCEWMDETNPLTGRPFSLSGRRFCRPAGELVDLRNYNPMERPFCADQALHPGQIRIFGPYLDASFGMWRLSVGQAVFDRRTGEFIACTSIDLSLELSMGILESFRQSDRRDLAVTRPDGSVVSASTSAADFSLRKETFHITETSFIDDSTYNALVEEYRFWDDVWDGSDDDFRSNSVRISNGRYYSVTASPPPPASYDPEYVPDFLVFSSYNIEDVQGVIQEISDEIDEDVQNLIVISLSLGSVGLVVLLVVVWVVALTLTKPLNYMDRTSWQIVNHAGQNKLTVAPDESSQDPDEKPFLFYTPRTELKELVGEFQVMIRGFSGEGVSRVASPQLHEIKNCVTWKDDFLRTYKVDSVESQIRAEMSTAVQSVGRRLNRIPSISRSLNVENEVDGDSTGNDFRSAEMGHTHHLVQTSGERSMEVVKTTSVSTPTTMTFQSEVSAFFASTKQNLRINIGRNLHDVQQSDDKTMEDKVRMSRSSLFWSILCWICLPILLSIIAISTIVAVRLLGSFPAWISSAESSSYALQLDVFLSEGRLRALYAEQMLPGPTRDLYLLTRITGWILFGAVGRSNSLTDIEMEFVEECKVYKEDEACPPFDSDIFRSPCDCTWEDPWRGDQRCQQVPADSRAIQRFWYLNQNRDFDPETGNRLRSESYPELDYSPETTSWWVDPDSMPGSFKGSNASGYTTAYDRLRVISAVSSVGFPIYNYVSNTNAKERHTAWSTYVAFESDGAFYGYAGCNYDFKTYANFESSEKNRAYLINEDLCPKGKYGYDPRCRQWYRDTKEEALNGSLGVQISLPYVFANSNEVGLSAGSPLIDPKTSDFVGVTLIDYSIGDIYDILERGKRDFYALISSKAQDIDTVVSSAQARGDPPVSSLSIFAPFDVPDEDNKSKLSSILTRVKSGKNTLEERFTRKSDDGEEEAVFVASFPIILREMTPVAPDDFTRGARVDNSLLYVLIFGISEENLRAAFNSIDDVIVHQLRMISIAYLSVVGFVTLCCIFLTARISVSVTKPMLQLLQVVRQVNAGGIEDDIPPLSGGSREVARVYSSFAKLYGIIRMSCQSFWSGDLDLAHHIAEDALQLFRKIADRKAVGIASNNIANIILTQIIVQKSRGCCKRVDGECFMQLALHLYDEAIDCAKNDFDRDDITDAQKALFAQQVADRLFNRGLLLLLSLDDPCSPADAKDRGLTDLFNARQYDKGTREYMLHTSTLYKNADTIFERIIRRLIGLAVLTGQDEDVFQAWDPYDLVDEADLILQAAWRDDNCILFRSISKIGRLQQLEGAVVALEMSSGSLDAAALLSSRMIVEDDYVIDSAFMDSSKCLLQMCRENEWSSESTLDMQRELNQMKASCKLKSLEVGVRHYVFCLDMTSDGIDLHSGSFNSQILELYNRIVYPEDKVAVVTSAGDGLVICRSSEGCENDPRSEIDRALSSINYDGNYRCAMLTAIDVVDDIAKTAEGDVVVIYITNGSVWDDNVYKSITQKVQHDQTTNKQKPPIHFIVIGFDLQDEVASFCSSLSFANKFSYLAVSSSDDESGFHAIAKVAGLTSRLNIRHIQAALTMEKF